MAVANKQPHSIDSVFDLPGKSWEIVKERWQLFAVVNIFGLLSAFFAIFEDSSSAFESQRNPYLVDTTFLSQELNVTVGIVSVLTLIFIVINIFLLAMSTQLQVASAQGKKPTADDLLAAAKKFWLRQFALIVLYVLIVLAGLVLLIVPGVFAITRLSMAPYLMFDKDLGVIESLKASNEFSKGNAAAIWAAIGVVILISFGLGILGVIPFIGTLISTVLSIAFTSMIMPLRYQEIKQSAKS